MSDQELETRKAHNFIFRLGNPGKCEARPATLGVKFSRSRLVLDDWHIVGGTRWTRTLMRLRHPLVYINRGFRKIYRRVKSIFINPHMIQPLANHNKKE